MPLSITPVLNSQDLYISVSNDKVLTIPLPDFKQEHPCSFVLGVRKSGSTVLNKIIHQLCRINKVPTISIANSAFHQNISFQEWSDCDELDRVVRDGAVYLGFRALPSFLLKNELFQTRKKIILVRDPRDAIVSQYFSTAFSHSIPKENSKNVGGPRETLLTQRQLAQSQSVDDYVLEKCVSLNRTISQYIPLLKSDHLKVYRYEDVILNKRPWIKEMANFLELDLSSEALDQVLSDVDIVPDKEAPTKFVRRVLPGDHKDKLMPETIEKLNDSFSDVISVFAY